VSRFPNGLPEKQINLYAYVARKWPLDIGIRNPFKASCNVSPTHRLHRSNRHLNSAQIPYLTGCFSWQPIGVVMLKKTVSIVNHAKLREYVESLEKRSADIKGRLAPTLKALWKSKSKKANQVIRKEIDFEKVRVAFPHFKEVINYIQLQANVSRKFGRPFKLSPMLFLGEAGLGKTLFASQLADLLKLPYFEMSLTTVTANFALSGTSLQWGEGSPGFIIKSLAESKTANPIILLDEIDKAGGSTQYSVISVFFSLLEYHTASRFKDEAIPLELDASNVNWVATANEVSRISQPILSRMKVFQIEQPPPQEMPGVIDSIYNALLKRHSLETYLSPKLDATVLEQLFHQTPRAVTIALDEAMMKAFLDGRENILETDITKPKQEVHRAGFL
jgi:ATP-dependent Lon protease